MCKCVKFGNALIRDLPRLPSQTDAIPGHGISYTHFMIDSREIIETSMYKILMPRFIHPVMLIGYLQGS